jgi:hypothetical protein
MNYSDYTIYIPLDPQYYGSICTPVEAENIARALASLVADRYPGIYTVLTPANQPPCSRAVSGPDPETVSEIANWVSDNWWTCLPFANNNN